MGVKGKLKSSNGHAVVGGTAKLADVGMVKTYSKSAHVNDLGFAWTGPPCCMDRLAPLFAWTSPPTCSYGFSARRF